MATFEFIATDTPADCAPTVARQVGVFSGGAEGIRLYNVDSNSIVYCTLGGLTSPAAGTPGVSLQPGQSYEANVWEAPVNRGQRLYAWATAGAARCIVTETGSLI